MVRSTDRMGSNWEAPEVVQVDPTTVESRGRPLAYFGGCDYFRLSWNGEVRAAVRRGLALHGPNVAASRATTGNHPLYAAFERDLARAFGFPAAILTASGYLAPLLAAQGFRGAVDRVFLATTAHGCLRDAADLLGVPQMGFDSVEALRDRLADLPTTGRPLVLTNGLSPLDGTMSPVADLLGVLPERGRLLVDDAHGVGTLGNRGRGTLEALGVRDPRVVLTGTFSKAFGCCGGFVLGPKTFRDVTVSSRLFQGGTPPPLPWMEGARTALSLIQERGEVWRGDLRERIQRVRAVFPEGDPRRDASGPTFVLVPKDGRAQSRMERRLRKEGLFPSWVRYAQGPADRFFRFALSSAHPWEAVDRLRGAVADCLADCC